MQAEARSEAGSPQLGHGRPIVALPGLKGPEAGSVVDTEDPEAVIEQVGIERSDRFWGLRALAFGRFPRIAEGKPARRMHAVLGSQLESIGLESELDSPIVIHPQRELENDVFQTQLGIGLLVAPQRLGAHPHQLELDHPCQHRRALDPMVRHVGSFGHELDIENSCAVFGPRREEKRVAVLARLLG